MRVRVLIGNILYWKRVIILVLVHMKLAWSGGFGGKAGKSECSLLFCCLFCTDACGDLMVTLQSVSRQGEKRNLQLSGSMDSVAFTFENVLPGKYKGRIMGKCFRSYLSG